MWVFRARRSRTLLVVLLAAALLLAAGVGLHHRVAHGLAKASDPAPAPSKTVLHSCAALDATALAVALAAGACKPVLWRQRPPVPGRAIPAPYDLPIRVHFRARAPPATLPAAPAPPGGTSGAHRA